MIVRFYKNFVKRYNSTKRPTGAYTELDCKMKAECSVKDPVLLIDGIDLEVNYCTFNGRYYFVEDITLNKNNIYEIKCTIDVLATYRPQISDYNAYVERSASKYDPYLSDDVLSISYDIINQDEQSTTLIGFDFSTGAFIFPVMNSNGVEIFMTQNLEDFGALFMPATYSSGNWWTNGVSAVMDMNQYFGKVIWIPFSETGFAPASVRTVNAGQPISVGPISWILNHDIKVITDSKYVHESNGVYRIQKPTFHYGDFRDMDSKWTKVMLYLPGVGKIELPPALAGNPDVEIVPYITFSPVTGDIRYRLEAFRNYNTPEVEVSLIGIYDGNLSYVIPWGDNQWGITEILKDTGEIPRNMVMGYLAGQRIGAGLAGMVIEGVKGVARTTADVFTVTQGNVRTAQGSITSLAGLGYGSFKMEVIQYGTPDIPNAVAGRPLYRNRQLGTLGGYIECGNASLEIAGFEDEKIKVNQFLTNGFYFE